jgi:iron complex outermembrane receptor protein
MTKHSLRSCRLIAIIVTCHLPALRSAALALCVVGALVTSPAAQAAPVSFDIAPQPAPAALDLFIKQSGAQVVYLSADVKDARTNAITGTFEPRAALGAMLKDTGLAFTEPKPGQFTVGRASGSVSGSLISARGAGSLAGVNVTVMETGARAPVSERGNFRFPELPPGTYTLVASGEGFSRLRITDVVVKAGTDTTLGAQEMPVPRRGDEVQTMKEVVVSAKKEVETLAAVEVSADKLKPFSTANVDLPRTVDDAKPYYQFSADTIAQSGAVNLEDFLRQRLTMVSSSQAASQNAPNNGFYGDSTVISLRGLGGSGGPVVIGGGGSAQTLILVNGRRMAGFSITGNATYQPDMSSIPMGSVESIEVVPSSASGIYGGGAAGGVINIILKRNYVGGELLSSYETPWDNSAPLRTLNANLGLSLEGGRTRVTLSASYRDAEPMRLQDRLDLIQRGIDRYLARSPTSLYSPTSPYFGSTPNIASSTSLVLKDGTPLNSNFTYIPAGTPANVSATTLASALLANAGKVNLERPDAISSRGLRSAVNFGSVRRSYSASINREMTQRLSLFADVSYSRGTTEHIFGLSPLFSNIPATSPFNPFRQAVTVNAPHQTLGSYINETFSTQLSAGFVVKMPWDWRAEGDYTWSVSGHDNRGTLVDSPAVSTALASGALNPFMDTLAYNSNMLAPFLGRSGQNGSKPTLNDVALRLSGPVWHLPAGVPRVTVGLERRREGAGNDAYFFSDNPVSPDSLTQYLGRSQTVDSLYVESSVPVVAPGQRVPLVHLLDLQLTGRTEKFSVTTGTSSITVLPAPATPPVIVPSKSKYTSTNPMLGIRLAPVKGVMFRANYSTSFLSPTSNQLVGNPTPSPTTTNVTDPRRGNSGAAVYTMTLGNASLKPQFTGETGYGVIFTPGFLPNFRLAIDYTNFRQKDVLGSLSIQNLINAEATFPQRITRGPVPAGDPYGVGPITLVDISALNLTKMETSMVDVTVDYRTAPGRLGSLTFSSMTTVVQTYKLQSTFNAPLLDYNNFVDNNAPAKLKVNGSVGWDFHNWGVNWSAVYTGPTYVLGSPRDPAPTAAFLPTYLLNGDHVPGQVYHDVTVRYRFGTPTQRIGSGNWKGLWSGGGSRSRSLVAGLEVTVGLKNVFNAWPPFSSNGNNPGFYSSSFGDPRLRVWWMSVKKEF